MEEILAMVDGMAGEDGKVEAAALKEALKGRRSDLQKSLREIFREKQGVSPKYHLTRARG